MSDLDTRRAEGIVHALTDQETATCSDCGETIVRCAPSAVYAAIAQTLFLAIRS